MKRILIALLLAALLPGCSSIMQQPDQPPIAYIDSITPAQSHEGDTVSFSGHGADVDGQVVAYSWRSDIDGQLGISASFQTSSLSVGDHEIFFTVQDNSGEWSAEVTGYVTVLAKVVAAVNVDTFIASPQTIHQGESATLSWSVSNASTVSIDQGIGTVASAGSLAVSPATTTTYTLTATATQSTAAASITVSVRPPLRRLTLTADPDNSGYIRSSGAGSGGYIYVGDDANNREIQGFVTLDISSLPNNAVLSKVIVDLSDYEISGESPFPTMGCLGAYVQDYGTLDNTDYWRHSISVPIGQWCSLGDLDTPNDMSGFRNELQRQVGENVFQFRLQFAGVTTNLDNKNDLLYWPPGKFPRITIEYST